jgi:rare lipoprotein A
VEFGERYKVLQSSNGFREKGLASWYGIDFHGRDTSSGEVYDMYEMTAAHKTLPLPTYVRVSNLDNGRSSIVKVNDRGPFIEGRIIDLSYAAAYRLGITGPGTANVEIIALEPAAVDPQR